MSGWIKLYRKMTDNPLWTCEPFTKGQAWVDLLLLANHKYGYFYVRDIKIEVQRGQVGWSERKLAERWKWSRTKLRKFLNDVEKEQQITQHKNNVTQIITILNYEEYQEKEPQVIPQQDHSKTTAEPQQDHNKNNKEESKKKEEVKGGFKKPSIIQIESYKKERNSTLDVQRFYDFYESKGWMVGKNKMKDWQAAFRNWDRDAKPDEKPKQFKPAFAGGWENDFTDV